MIYAWGNCYHTGCKALARKFRQIVGPLSIPWGNTVHWNISCDSFKLTEGIEKANIGWSSGYKGIVKKQSLGSVTNKCHLEKAMAPHSITLAWKIPWTKESGRLQSTGSLRVGHDWATSLHFSLSCTGEGNGNPLQYPCLENPRDGEAWWAAI